MAMFGNASEDIHTIITLYSLDGASVRNSKWLPFGHFE